MVTIIKKLLTKEIISFVNISREINNTFISGINYHELRIISNDPKFFFLKVWYIQKTVDIALYTTSILFNM